MKRVSVAVHKRRARNRSLLGTWKLKSFTTEYLDDGEIVRPYGAHPGGYLSYGSDGRMYAIVVSEQRKAPAGIVPTPAERTALFDGFAAYAGTYTIDADKVSHHVEVSWNEAWTGTTQVREFRITARTLELRSMPAQDPLDGRLSSSTAVWTRVA
jgi:hypothetical protein